MYRRHLSHRRTFIEAKYGPAFIKIGVESPSLGPSTRKELAVLVWRAIESSRVLEFQWSEIHHSDRASGLHAFEPKRRVKTRQAIDLQAPHVQKGLHIRLRRKQLCLTQSQLAKAAGIDRSHLSHIEHGRVDPLQDTWESLRKVLYPEAFPQLCQCPCHKHATI